jgi:hypothetical protein
MVGGDDLVAEDLAPGGERLVAGDDQAGAFVAAGDEREHQVGRLRVEGDVADLVDDQQGGPEQPAQLFVEACLALGVGEAGDPFGRGREGDALAGEASADAERDREVRLAGAGRVGVVLLTLLIGCRSGCASCVRRAISVMSSWRCLAGAVRSARRRLSVVCSTVVRARSRPAGPICRYELRSDRWVLSLRRPRGGCCSRASVC